MKLSLKDELTISEPVAVFENGCIRLRGVDQKGNLPVGDDQARVIRNHMARPAARQFLGETAARYVRDLDAALEASAAEQKARS